jgi:hypothetical protein
MGNSAPAKRLNGKIFTSAECLKIAERKMGEAIVGTVRQESANA